MIAVNRSFKLAFSLIFRDINRITTCKTTVTAEAGRLSSKASISVYGEVGQGIRADFCCDLLHGMEPAGNQVFPGIHVGSEEAGRPERRRRNTHSSCIVDVLQNKKAKSFRLLCHAWIITYSGKNVQFFRFVF